MPIPSRPQARPTWAPRWYARRIPSGPTSSASQASSAPLLNVQPKPSRAEAAKISQTLEAAVPITATPITTCASTTETRRPYVSATIPVGTSKRK